MVCSGGGCLLLCVVCCVQCVFVFHSLGIDACSACVDLVCVLCWVNVCYSVISVYVFVCVFVFVCLFLLAFGCRCGHSNIDALNVVCCCPLYWNVVECAFLFVSLLWCAVFCCCMFMFVNVCCMCVV